jgi:hypothetical protein
MFDLLWQVVRDRLDPDSKEGDSTPTSNATTCRVCNGTGQVGCAAYKHGPDCACGGTGWDTCYHCDGSRREP